ncbi:hypothetical protein QYE76_015969 [Lolium multiflorum]|uniref:Uncharacterized protein n=1 Tax=Lolium multiflorum TaxID=4521 RepID=A0AAD8X9N2_LOLMU|nr:hypothetical protein QYE76_015969 [Lolium multiflorum]
MGATFSSVVEAWTTRATGVQVPTPAPAGCDEKKPVSSNVVNADAAQVQAHRAAPGPGGDDKTSWPELVGRIDVDAAIRIVRDRPEVRVYFYDYNYKNPPPTDFNPKRVNLFSDSRSRVLTVPKIG